MTTFKDTDLREALRRNYVEEPQLSKDFTQHIIEAVHRQRRLKRRHLFLKATLAGFSAAAILLLGLFIARPKSETPIASSPTTVAIAVKHTPQSVVQVKTEASPVHHESTKIRKIHVHRHALPSRQANNSPILHHPFPSPDPDLADEQTQLEQEMLAFEQELTKP